MALNATLCASAIVTALESAGNLDDLDASAKSQLTSDLEVFIGALFTHIVTNMQVTTAVTVSSVSGVVSGPGTSGPGAGTGTGTVI